MAEQVLRTIGLVHAGNQGVKISQRQTQLYNFGRQRV